MILRLIPEKVILQILRDCMYGLQCLHSQSVVHRDIKPQNLFLRDGRVKIGDLGVAATFTASTGQQTCTGTVQYMAPEMIKGEPYAFSADIWSLGCVFAQLVNRFPLFPEDSEISTLFSIFQYSLYLSFRHRKLGTPDESTWPGISQLEDYSPLYPKFPQRSIGVHVPALDPVGVDLLSVRF